MGSAVEAFVCLPPHMPLIMSSQPEQVPTIFDFVVQIDEDGFGLHEFALRSEWTAFEAACLIAGLQPIEIVGSNARVGVLESSMPSNEYLESFDHGCDRHASCSNHIAMLNRAILHRWPSGKVSAKEVVEWAVQSGAMESNAFTRGVLGVSVSGVSATARRPRKVTKDSGERDLEDRRGLHHAEKRLAILGAAIRELALAAAESGKIDRLLHGDSVNAAGLANHLDKFRNEIGLPDEAEHGFGPRQIEDVLREALKAADSLSTHKS